MSWILPTAKPVFTKKTKRVVFADRLDRSLQANRRRTKRWRVSSAGKEWYAKNRARKLAYLKQWRIDNQQKVLDYEAKRSSEQFGNASSLTSLGGGFGNRVVPKNFNQERNRFKAVKLIRGGKTLCPEI